MPKTKILYMITFYNNQENKLDKRNVIERKKKTKYGSLCRKSLWSQIFYMMDAIFSPGEHMRETVLQVNYCFSIPTKESTLIRYFPAVASQHMSFKITDQI